MSKQDIQNVCTLSAYLATIIHGRRMSVGIATAECGRDAMRLQKLGLRANRSAEKACNDSTYTEERQAAEEARIAAKVANILQSYGLTAKISGDPRGYCLKIQGLPGNTCGGDEEGFGI